MKIRVKILILVFATALISCGLTTLVSRTISTDIVENEINDHLVTTAQSRSHNIETTIAGQKWQIEMFAAEAGIFLETMSLGFLDDSTSFAMNQELIKGMESSSEYIREVLVLDENGMVSLSSDHENVGFDASSSEIFLKGKEGSIVGDMFFGEPTKDLVLAAAAPVWVHGEFGGVAVFLGGEEQLFEITTDHMGMGETCDVYIVNEEGYMITPSRFMDNAILNQYVDLHNLGFAPEEISVDNQHEAITVTNYMDSKVLAVHQYLPEVGWTVVAEMSKSEAFAPVSNLTSTLLWVMCGVLVIGALFAILISRAMSKPILRLRQGAEEIIKGNLDYKVSTSSGDEVGDLSRAFSRMTASLKKSSDELRKYSTELEQMVEKRTEELTETNHTLTLEIAERKKAEDNVRKLNEALEQRVLERTAELKKANDQLNLDIIERKQTEVALREAERRFRAIFDNPMNIMFELDAQGVIVDANEQSLRRFGYSRDQVGRISIADLLHPEDLPRAVKANNETMSVGYLKHPVEVRVMTSEGEEIWIEATGLRISDAPGTDSYRGLGIARDITERKQSEADLKAAQKKLVETARQAGMAEVATGVLHNVGNVVNSVGITTSSIQETIRASRMSNLIKVAAMLEEHQDRLEAFLTIDERGRKLPTYISALAKHLAKEQEHLNKDLKALSEHMKHIIEIVNVQQSYGKAAGLTELVSPIEIIEDAIRINEGGLIRHGVEVIKEYEDLPPVLMDRHKTMQILTNLISNAKYAVCKNEELFKVLTLQVKTRDDAWIVFKVVDNGIGIAKEDMMRIFSYGFTTKKDGHGFGLHSGALAAKEMGGSLHVYSDGPGAGATFILELPVNDKDERKCEMSLTA